MNWRSSTDIFTFDVPEIEDTVITKRTILSNSAKLFDPLGLVNPITVLFKIMLQELWQGGLDWDVPVPENMEKRWRELTNLLSALKSLVIPRLVLYSSNGAKYELIRFCDASERAYGACVYLRSKLQGSEYGMQLLTAKSRVSPLKTLTIPRLELSAVLLLAQLMRRVRENFKFNLAQQIYYTDSTIVLNWLHTTSSNLKIFVANRVEEILNHSSLNQWRVIPFALNAADVLSRGCMPTALIEHITWWNGPETMRHALINIPFKIVPSEEELPEFRRKTFLCSAPSNFELMDKFGSCRRLLRVTAYCQRFIKNCCTTATRITGTLQTDEIADANITLIRLIQRCEFGSELECLKANKSIKSKSKLLNLNPFLNSDNVICVGGRLRNADLSMQNKFPYILPKSNFTDLIIKQIHEDNFHSGTLTTLALVRQKYWPLGGKNSIKGVLKNCVQCFKNRPTSNQPIMGDLPAARVNVCKPFTDTGVDFCGPFLIKEGKRKVKVLKAYAAVFICFATKAIHIEIVSDLTSEAFIAAMRRFIGRRGKCLNIYSDNATNFVGATSELKRLRKAVHTDLINDKLRDQFSSEGLEWNFIPARSPHFGGSGKRP